MIRCEHARCTGASNSAKKNRPIDTGGGDSGTVVAVRASNSGDYYERPRSSVMSEKEYQSLSIGGIV